MVPNNILTVSKMLQCTARYTETEQLREDPSSSRSTSR